MQNRGGGQTVHEYNNFAIYIQLCLATNDGANGYANLLHAHRLCNGHHALNARLNPIIKGGAAISAAARAHASAMALTRTKWPLLFKGLFNLPETFFAGQGSAASVSKAR